MSSSKCLIFDMDLTLLDTLDIWRRAETRYLEHLGQRYDAETARLYRGMSALDVGSFLFNHFRPQGFSLAACGHMVHDLLIEYSRGPVKAMPGAHELLSLVKGHFTLAVASGSPPEVIHNLLRQHGWSSLFNVIVSSEEVAKGKPSPDVFLLASERLGRAPADCVVFEDSLAGVQAAKAAGMKCLVVPSGDDPLIRSTASRSFTSLRQIGVSDIENL